MPGFYDTLEQNIARVGGKDEAYRLKLKSSIREALGYSNYVAKKNAIAGKPLDLSLLKGNITPSGVESLVRGAMDNKNTEVSTYQGMVNKVDTAAGSLADDRIAKERAAANARANQMGFENGIAFQPKDELDSHILKNLQDPYNYNPDGTRGEKKSPQQMEAELNAYFNAQKDKNMVSYDANGNMVQRAEITPEEVKQRLQERMPKDYIGNEDKYFLMSRGYSEKQAKEYAGASRYESMSEPEKLVYATTHPEMAKALDSGQISKELIQDATDTQAGGIPKYTFEELKQKYPNTPEADLKLMVKPAETKSALDDISQWYSGDMKNAVDEIMNKKVDDDGGFTGLQKDPSFKEFKNKMEMEYGSVLTTSEIDRLIYQTIRK